MLHNLSVIRPKREGDEIFHLCRNLWQRTLRKNFECLSRHRYDGVELLGSHSLEVSSIDIHVTHDWNILAVRDLLLNVKHEEKGWPHYLDGVILTRDVNKITLRWRDITKTVDRKILNL